MTIKQLPFQTQIVDPVIFDVAIRPVKELVTTDGVQYATPVNVTNTTYKDLFSIETHTDYPTIKGKLAYVYVNISFEVLGGSANPTLTYKLEAKNSSLSSWTIMSAEETYVTTTSYVGKRLEAFLKLTADAIDYAPFSIRLQFKSDATGANEDITLKLKNDTIIQPVGTREVR